MFNKHIIYFIFENLPISCTNRFCIPNENDRELADTDLKQENKIQVVGKLFILLTRLFLMIIQINLKSNVCQGKKDQVYIRVKKGTKCRSWQKGTK